MVLAMTFGCENLLESESTLSSRPMMMLSYGKKSKDFAPRTLKMVAVNVM